MWSVPLSLSPALCSAKSVLRDIARGIPRLLRSPVPSNSEDATAQKRELLRTTSAICGKSSNNLRPFAISLGREDLAGAGLDYGCPFRSALDCPFRLRLFSALIEGCTTVPPRTQPFKVPVPHGCFTSAWARVALRDGRNLIPGCVHLPPVPRPRRSLECLPQTGNLCRNSADIVSNRGP